MSEVRRYYVNIDHGTLYVPRPGCDQPMVKAHDFIRIEADRDAALGREAALREERNELALQVERLKADNVNFDRLLCRSGNQRDALQALLTAADERADRLERKAREDTTIDERDRYHEMADRLALAISNHFRVEIGEHSSMNCPWTEALNVMNGEYVTDSDHERRVGVLEGLLLQTNELLYAIQGDPGAVPASSIDAMRGEVFTALKPAEGDRDDA